MLINTVCVANITAIRFAILGFGLLVTSSGSGCWKWYLPVVNESRWQSWDRGPETYLYCRRGRLLLDDFAFPCFTVAFRQQRGWWMCQRIRAFKAERDEVGVMKDAICKANLLLLAPHCTDE